MSLITAATAKASAKIQLLVILLHGYGSNGHDLIQIGQYWFQQTPQIEFVAPHAPFPCRGNYGGYQWFGLQDFDMQRISKEVEHAYPRLRQYIDEQVEACGITHNKVVLVGFSQGAMMSLYAGLRMAQEGKACRGIISYAGMMADSKFLALTTEGAENKSYPSVLLVHGDHDNVVSVQGSYTARDILQRHNIPVVLQICRGLGHSINHEGLQYGQDFLQQCLRSP